MKSDPKELAISLIKPYVERGDDLKSLIGYMGQSCADYDVAIGGYALKNGEIVHKGTNREIVVSKINGEDCCYVFSLEKLFNEVKSGQVRLI